MAQKVTVTIYDDIDGTEAAETTEFSLDGVDYTIDLSADNSIRLRETLRPFMQAARRADRHARPQRKPRSSGIVNAPGEQRRAREWARQRGIQVAEIGRLSTEVMERYRRATAS